MRTGLPWILGAWLIAAIPAFAQSPPPAIPAETEVPGNLGARPGPEPFRVWVRAEYLSYWVKNAPLPISLLTGDPNNPTQELLDSDQKLGMFSGFRLGFGGWLDYANNLGLEANFFALQRRSREFSASSDDVGNPVLALPFINQTPGQVGNLTMWLTSPGQFAGDILVASTLQLWGAETNGLLSLVRQGNLEFIALVGFRYIDLQESLEISTVSAAINTNPVTVLSQIDRFNTRNQFYGAQIGGRLNWQGERFALDVTGKLAVGAAHQTVDIQGGSAQYGPGGVNGAFPGGFFTQSSNIGSSSANRFTIIPALEMKLSMLFTSRLRGFVGYDFMYWSRVVRPGNQIDPNINLTQSAVYGNGALTGSAYPTTLFGRTDFWAQGISLGLELRY